MYCINVYENEPNPRKDLYLTQKLLVHHIGAATKEAQNRIGEELAEQIINEFVTCPHANTRWKKQPKVFEMNLLEVKKRKESGKKTPHLAAVLVGRWWIINLCYLKGENL